MTEIPHVKPGDPQRASDQNALIDAVNGEPAISPEGVDSTGGAFSVPSSTQVRIYELTEDITYPDSGDTEFPDEQTSPPDVPYAENSKAIWLDHDANGYSAADSIEETLYFPTITEFTQGDPPRFVAGDRVAAVFNRQSGRWEMVGPAQGTAPILVAATFNAIDQGTSTGDHLGIAQIPFDSALGKLPLSSGDGTGGPSTIMQMDGNGTVTVSGGALLFTVPGIYAFRTQVNFFLNMPIKPDGQDSGLHDNGYRVRMRIGFEQGANEYKYASGEECYISAPTFLATKVAGTGEVDHFHLDVHAEGDIQKPAKTAPLTEDETWCAEGIVLSDGEFTHPWVMSESRPCTGFFLIHPDLVPCKLEFVQEGTFNNDNPESAGNTITGDFSAEWREPWTGTWKPNLFTP